MDEYSGCCKMEYETKTINTLREDTKDSLSSNFDLKKLRKRFDENFILWKSLSSGDSQRQLLADENLKIIDLIIAGC